MRLGGLGGGGGSGGGGGGGRGKVTPIVRRGRFVLHGLSY